MNKEFMPLKEITAKTLMVLLTVVCITTLTADPKTRTKRPAPQLASMVPSIDILKKDQTDEIVKFIGCDSENECYRTLQELDLGATTPAPTDGFALTAEFVESPRKGIMVYRRQNP